MVVLDVAIVNVALPSIQTDLDISRSTLQWIVTAYSLSFGGFLLLGGRAADIFGRRRVFMIGMVIFTTGSLACALSNSGLALILFRAYQGLGSENLVGLKMADVLRGLDTVVVPAGGKSGVNPLDLEQALELFDMPREEGATR